MLRIRIRCFGRLERWRDGKQDLLVLDEHRIHARPELSVLYGNLNMLIFVFAPRTQILVPGRASHDACDPFPKRVGHPLHPRRRPQRGGVSFQR